ANEQRLERAASRPFLERANADVARAAGLFETLASRVEQFGAVDAAERRCGYARAEREPGRRYAVPDEERRVSVAAQLIGRRHLRRAIHGHPWRKELLRDLWSGRIDGLRGKDEPSARGAR